MVVLGALIVDIAYGIVALFGIAPYLKDEKVMAIFWLAAVIARTGLTTRLLKKRLTTSATTPAASAAHVNASLKDSWKLEYSSLAYPPP